MRSLLIVLVILSGGLPQFAFGRGRGPLHLVGAPSRLNSFSNSCVPVTPDDVLRVANRGASNLEFAVTEHPNVTWLELDRTHEQLTPGASRPVTISYRPGGLEEGAYRCWLRFKNVARPRNSVKVLITLYVGASFIPGDVIEAHFSCLLPGPTHFDGVAGMQFKLSWIGSVYGTPEAGLWAQVLDPAGRSVGEVIFDDPDPSNVESITLETTGRHTLWLFPTNISLFATSIIVRVKTDRYLPKPLRTGRSTIELGRWSPFALPLQIPGPSCFVYLKLKARRRFDTPALIAPDGSIYSDSAAMVRLFVLKRAVLPMSGGWTVAGAGRGRLKFKYRLSMPPGSAAIQLGCG